jgi:hypothetical protein
MIAYIFLGILTFCSKVPLEKISTVTSVVSLLLRLQKSLLHPTDRRKDHLTTTNILHTNYTYITSQSRTTAQIAIFKQMKENK